MMRRSFNAPEPKKTSGKSLPVMTARTPGRLAALVVSILVIRAWLRVLVSNLHISMSGR